MPSTVLDARSVTAPPSTPALPAAPRRRTPLPVAAAGVLAVLESLGLLALGLTGLNDLLGTALRPSGALVALTLALLAGWVVLAAGGGAGLVDGAGRLLMVAVSCGEIALLLVLGSTAVLSGDGGWQLVVGPLGALPVPALTLLALVVPTAKLLLAGSPAAVAWVAAGPRPPTRRPAPAQERRLLRGATVAAIGLALTGVALLGSPAVPASAPVTAAVSAAP